MMAEVLLTVDTSTPAGSIALSRGETLLGEILLNVPTTHTDRLLVTARQLLADAGIPLGEVDAFGVVLGPGSFTGLRVGVATVKGLALAAGRPVAGVSSLQTLAMQAPYSRHPVCALLDARKKEVYAGLYTWEEGWPVAMGPERAISPEQLLATLDEEVVFVGDGAAAYRTLIIRQLGPRAHFAPWPARLPRASAAAALALAALRAGETMPLPQLVPRYLRPSEAEILWARRVAEGAIDG
jgi:tRNA threonylcarbamoyladenosine biosynthesis protein TsaB